MFELSCVAFKVVTHITTSEVLTVNLWFHWTHYYISGIPESSERIYSWDIHFDFQFSMCQMLN